MRAERGGTGLSWPTSRGRDARADAVPALRPVFIFPGQGSQSPNMLDRVRSYPDFPRLYRIVCELAGTDVDAALADGGERFARQNRNSSLLTLLVSLVELAAWRREGGDEPCFVAGYSVGQWTALHAAGVLDEEAVLAVVARRAEAMDDCVRREPGEMHSVLGLREEAVDAVLAGLRAEGHRVFVSNYNCLGNCTIAGTALAIAAAVARLEQLNPKRMAPVPVSGAWHCPLLSDAEDEFGRWLGDVELAPAKVPVVDNVTGRFLPEDPIARRHQLARHLTHPVRWDAGIRHCIEQGATRFVEFGHGASLSKLGFFIDRTAVFEQAAAAPFMSSQPQARPSPCAA